jgi:hypothetical protein
MFQVINNLENQSKKYYKFIQKLEKAPPDSVSRKLRNCPLALECLQVFEMGDRDEHSETLKNQQKHLEKYLKLANRKNLHILPALVNPTDIPKTQDVTGAGHKESVEAAVIVSNHSWRYLKRLPGARQKLMEFLHPDQKKNEERIRVKKS